MRFEIGDDVAVVGPSSEGHSDRIGELGEVASKFVLNDQVHYMIELEDIVMAFPTDSLRLADEDLFGNVVPLFGDEKTKVDIGLKHIITIHGNNFLMSTAEIKNLKNILAAIV